MKQIILILLMISVSSAVDVSIETDGSKSIKRDKSISISDNETSTRTEQSNRSHTVSTKIDLSMMFMEELNYSCVNNPKTLNDFGLNYVENGIIDTTKRDFLQNAGSNSMFLYNIGISEKNVKKYMKCLIGAGAKLAQASLNFSKYARASMNEQEFKDALQESLKSAEKKSLKIKLLEKSSLSNLKKNPCRFFNSHEVIICGNISLEMSATSSNKIMYLNHPLFGDGSNNYGVSSTIEISLVDNINSEKSSSNVESSSQSKTISLSKSKNNKKSLSIGKFLPGL